MATKKVDEKSFGGRLQQLRLTKRISFARLSTRTGFSQRYLKEIEEGIAITPVSAVIQIAKTLSVDSGSFLSAGGQEASRKKRKESFFKRTQAYSYKTLTPGAEEKHMKAFLVTIDPRQGHHMVEYRHEGEEFLYVIHGNVEVRVGEDQHFLKRGESLHFDSGVTHNLLNHGGERAKLLVVIYTA